MAGFCTKCGAELTEGNSFCTKCGARRSDTTDATPGGRFCTKCGAGLAANLKFCTKCGAPADVTSTAPPPATVAADVPPSATQAAGSVATQSVRAGAGAATPPPSAQPAGSGAPAAKSSGIPKVPVAVVAVVLVLIVGAVVGVTYVVHRVRQKAAQIQAQAEIEKGLAGLASAGSAIQNGNNPAAVQDLARQLANLATQSGNNPAAVQEAQKKLAALLAAAQDPKTQAALRDLNDKLAGLSATGQNSTNPPSTEDVNKDLAAVAAAANALGQGQPGASPSAGISGTGGAASSGSSAAGSNSGSPSGSLSNLVAASAAADAALIPPLLPKPAPIVPVAGTGDPKHDWPLEYERTVDGPEADLVVRTGDINNLGLGWPKGFDPFSGQSTSGWPNNDKIPPNAPPGTDRIMVGTAVMPVRMSIQHVAGQPDRIAITVLVKPGLPNDGFSGTIGDCFTVRDFGMQLEDPHAPILIASKEEGEQELTRFWAPKCTRERALSMPTPIVLDVGGLPSTINAIVVQIFADDFQPRAMGSHFQVSLNGTRIPSFEYAINSLDQGGPAGKLLTLNLLPEYWPLLKSGQVKLLIDDPTTHVPDGYAIDFVRILVNPHKFKYQVSLTATVTDADTHKPITGATVAAGLSSISTDRQGKCELKGIPAGLVVATASAPGYDENSVPVDLPAGQTGNADIQLHRHQESTAALEQSIAQTGTATIYGIHFDTGSSKLRGDSLPALNAVLGLINGRPGSSWIIAGHTDNQGSDALNIPLSKARAASVVSWLTAHGVAAGRLERQGFGSTRPVADNATASGRALNRRVEVALAK